MLHLKIKHNLQKSVTSVICMYSQVEHTYIVSAYNDDLRNVQSIWVKKLRCIKSTWVTARLMNKNGAFVMQWGFGCLKWEQRKRREGKSKPRLVTGVALTKMHDNCQALSKIKSKEICIKWYNQSTVHGKKKTKILQCTFAFSRLQRIFKFRGLSSVCVYGSDLHIFHTDPLVIGQNGPHRHCFNTLLLLREWKRRKKHNHKKKKKTSFFSQHVQHALEQKV